MTKLCVIEGCENEAPKGRMCPMHQMRRSRGSEDITTPRVRGPKPGTQREKPHDTHTGFTCPYCEVSRTSVVDSRQDSDGHIRRRRECLTCGGRFTTREVPENHTIIPSAKAQQFLLFKKLLPHLFEISDTLDLMRAEHEP